MAREIKGYLVLKWKNKCDGSEGFVKDIKYAKGYFENTFNIMEAKSFKTQITADKAMKFLNEIGETQRNDFEFVLV